MNVYSYTDYRDWIREEVQRKRQDQSAMSFSFLAQKASIQPSYLSKIVAKEGHLASDQLFLVANALDVSEDEMEFLLLLLEWNRTNVEPRKIRLLEKIKKLQEQACKTENYIGTPTPQLSPREVELYFLDPLKQLVHVCLTIERFRRDPHGLSRALGIDHQRLQQCLHELESIKLISFDGDRLVDVTPPAMHLPKDSPVCAQYAALQRTLGLAQLQRLPFEKAYAFSATFSATAEAKKQIQEEFFRFIAVVRELVRDAEPNEVYQLNFDLFPWLTSDSSG